MFLGCPLSKKYLSPSKMAAISKIRASFFILVFVVVDQPLQYTISSHCKTYIFCKGHHDRMVVGYTTNYAIGDYHH